MMKILGYEYAVDQSLPYDQIGTFGRCNTKELLIQIASDINPQQQTSTMIHEALEAIICHLELQVPHNEIMAIEAGMYQFLIDNGVDLTPLLGKPE